MPTDAKRYCGGRRSLFYSLPVTVALGTAISRGPYIATEAAQEQQLTITLKIIFIRCKSNTQAEKVPTTKNVCKHYAHGAYNMLAHLQADWHKGDVFRPAHMYTSAIMFIRQIIYIVHVFHYRRGALQSPLYFSINNQCS